jgi:hypothetical protein
MFAGRGSGRGRGRGSGRGRGGGGRGSGGRSRGGQRGDFPPGLGGNSGNRWNGHDISDLTIYFPGNVFSSFPQALKSKIHHAKQASRGNDGDNSGEKRNISFVEYDDMRSQVSTMHEELSQVRAVMQASRDNGNTSTTGESAVSAASAFGRPGLPPAYKKKKR